MRTRKNSITPLAAVATGLLAGVIGTACMDTVRYVMYRRAGGKAGPLAWEFAPVDSWEQAPDPGQVAKRVIEGFTQRQLPDRWAFPISTMAHWCYGSTWASLYGVLAGSLRRPHALYGLPLGATAWASGYVVLPAAGLYKPIWEYDAKTLAKDLSAHLAYGAGTGAAFWLLLRQDREGRVHQRPLLDAWPLPEVTVLSAIGRNSPTLCTSLAGQCPGSILRKVSRGFELHKCRKALFRLIPSESRAGAY